MGRLEDTSLKDDEEGFRTGNCRENDAHVHDDLIDQNHTHSVLGRVVAPECSLQIDEANADRWYDSMYDQR